MAAMGEKWLPSDAPKAARDKVKVLINGAEMHMSMSAWRAKYGLPGSQRQLCLLYTCVFLQQNRLVLHLLVFIPLR